MKLRFRFMTACAFMALVPAFVTAGTDTAIEGSWQGTLSVPGAQLRIVFNISRSATGTLSATMDSPDQGASGIALGAVTFDGGHLHIDAPALQGAYDGNLKEPDLAFEGTWTQGGTAFPLTLTRGQSAPQAAPQSTPAQEIKLSGSSDAQDVRGTWSGVLSFSGVAVRVAFNFSVDSTGRLSSTLDSPDQGARDIPVDTTTFSTGHLRLVSNSIGGTFDGGLSEDKTTVAGKWSQGGMTIPLSLQRSEREPEPVRPQEPKPPLPYDEREVSYANSSAGVTLAGTLTLPRSGGPFPAVLLITGSGAQDRNEALMGHKPFLVLADYLTRRGLAVLRVDDRGIGKSTGSFSRSTSKDFEGDVLAGIAYLKSLSEIDSHRIGLVGHSEGGLIAPLAAVESPDVAFIVMMAGPGLTGEQILYLQGALIAKAEGVSDDMIAKDRAIKEKTFAVALHVADTVEAAKQIRQVVADALSQLTEEEKKSPMFNPGAIEASVRELLSPWMRYFLAYDPVPTLKRVKCPVLAINGEKDLQVPPKENLKAIDEALKAGGNKDYVVKEMPGLNHLFQTCKTGSPTEYGQIEETISPVALTTIGDWILAHTKAR
jgi:uncharacterized protein